MRLEHLLSGAQTNDDVVDTEMTSDTSQRSLASRKTVLFNYTTHKRKMKPGALATEPPRRKLSASPIAQLVRAPH